MLSLPDASSTPMIPQEAALRVVKGAIATSLAGSTVGSIYGAVKGQPATVYAFHGGANAFIFAFPFFALREYVVSPLLVNDYSSQYSIHTNNVGASAISGAMVGGGLAAYFRGPHKMLPGLTTFGVACTGMQLLGNELRVLRLHMLAGQAASLGNSDVAGADVVSSTPSLRGAPATAARPVDSPPKPTPIKETPSSSSFVSRLSQVGSYLSSISPVRKVSDEEYQAQLQERRRQVMEKLKEVESGIAAEQEKQV